MQTPQNKESLQQALDQFTGTEKGYRHCLVRALLYTEGTQFFFEETQSYWLLDSIATEYWPMLDGYQHAYPGTPIRAGITYDILDLGHWLESGEYEPPCLPWREERDDGQSG